ncbi:MAG: TIGR03960 family B12-binding radical SAM protein [Deltaproteobacteria bacterium]|nr:TIGR03960 family B12-binding radical SAM protein [Deltaproteobacteria bacterium]
MTPDLLQGVLESVEQPSRYLGGETNSVRKDPARVRLNVALAFPDLYEIGMSHFGMQILYEVLNRDPRIGAERVFAPAPDMDRALAARGLPLVSLENRRPLADFDIVGFSLLYELNYTNVLAMLERAGIPPRAAARDQRQPLVIAGGPCTCNPEPLAPFFDAMVIGDGEEVVLAMAEAWLAWNRRHRRDLLEAWARIGGVYVPSFYRAHYDEQGFQHLAPVAGAPMAVRRAVVTDLDRATFPERPVVPFGRPVHDRLRLEIARGCTRGCRFCQAGMLYRPVRERSPARLMEMVRRGLATTGYEDVSLLSLSTGDYSGINGLTAALMAECVPRHVAVSLPSLRIGSLSPTLMEQIRRVRKTGFTFAVEAGSQRLRGVINKNITEAEVFQTLQDAFDLGWQTVKLYFMIGLPTETEADIEAIVSLVGRLRKLRPPGKRRGQLNVSVATFIPKAHTPFQWAGQERLEAAQAKISRLRRQLTRPGIQFKWQNPQVSLMEGLWARGDRRLAPLLEEAYRRGCRLDGWSQHFRFDRWQEAIAACRIDLEFFTMRPRGLDEPLPWDHVSVGVDKDFLQREWRRAQATTLTDDCRQGECQGCGVCDFAALAPVVHAERDAAALDTAVQAVPPGAPAVFRLRFRKAGPARFFGHLETAAIFQRALRRAGLPVVHGGGFHPKPKMAFDDALPLGLESEAEFVTVHLERRRSPADIIAGLNRQLPEGLTVLAAWEGNGPGGGATIYRYRVRLPEEIAVAEPMARFNLAHAWPMERRSAKGRLQRIDLKQAVCEMALDGDGGMSMGIRQADGPSVRPVDVLTAVFGLAPDQAARVRVCKTGVAPAQETER